MTGILAWLRTFCATLPMSRPRTPPEPCVPITIRSQLFLRGDVENGIGRIVVGLVHSLERHTGLFRRLLDEAEIFGSHLLNHLLVLGGLREADRQVMAVDDRRGRRRGDEAGHLGADGLGEATPSTAAFCANGEPSVGSRMFLNMIDTPQFEYGRTQISIPRM